MSKFQLTIMVDSAAALAAIVGQLGADFGHAIANNAGDDDGPPNTEAPPMDATGLPWDERIHSGGKQMNSDRTWRRKRNLQDAYYNQIVAEIRAKAATQVAPTTTAAPPPPGMQAGVNAATAGAVPPPPTAPTTTAAPPPPPPTVAAGMQFGTFMPIVTQAMNAGRFQKEQLDNYLRESFGVTEYGQLAADPIKTEQVYNLIKQAGWVD